MDVVDQKKNSHVNGDSLSGSMSIEGTAARTRPFSFEEVMLRRKNKGVMDDVKDGASDPGKQYKTDDTGRSLGHGIQKLKMDTKDKEVSGKTEDRNREEIASKKGEHYSKSINKVNSDLGIDMKEKHKHHKHSDDKHSKNDAKIHHRGRTDARIKDEYEKSSRKKHSEDGIAKDKYIEKDRDPERKKKRLHHTISDAKIKYELRRSDFKKELEFSERGRRHEGSKSRSRRSRSREYYRKRQRSISFSPRPHRHPYYEESSPHFKGRSGRHYSNNDKYRTSQSGGHDNRHHRHHGSGLGGYSPRKRRIKSTAKSPSPVFHSPEKKGATWDQPPGGYLPGNSQSKLTGKDNSLSAHRIIQVASEDQSVPSANTTVTVSNISADSIQLTQATRPMRRLYIENLPTSASDKAMINWLNEALLRSSGSQSHGTPCISCMINKEKAQAVVEFLTPEDATMALSYNGKSFSGSVLKIRRPKDFINTTSGSCDKPLAAAEENHAIQGSLVDNSNQVWQVEHTISDVVKDSAHKLFIGGISESISAHMLMEIVGAFGPLKSYHFEINEELNEPCAFLEYLDQSVTINSLAGLNGMKLGGRTLTVVRALSSDHFNEDTSESTATYTIPEHARPLLENPTRVLKLTNVFNHEEFTRLSETELEQILEDIRLECARFGSVKSLNVVRCSSKPDTDSGVCEQNASVQKDPETKEENSVADAMLHTGAMSHDEPLHVHETDENSPPDDTNSRDNLDNNESCITTGIDDHEQSLISHVVVESSQVDLTDNVADENEKKELGLKDGVGFEQLNLEDKTNESKVTDMEKPEAEIKDGNSTTFQISLFEPMTVLVEFVREEATLMAAQCLNGRLYGDQVVSACYASFDAYCAQFQ